GNRGHRTPYEYRAGSLPSTLLDFSTIWNYTISYESLSSQTNRESVAPRGRGSRRTRVSASLPGARARVGSGLGVRGGPLGVGRRGGPLCLPDGSRSATRDLGRHPLRTAESDRLRGVSSRALGRASRSRGASGGRRRLIGPVDANVHGAQRRRKPAARRGDR